jgi:T4 gene Gp59 loader of gp41 DNA helicase/T4 gene Gp59 loader of gp41 DNA helicase C-term
MSFEFEEGSGFSAFALYNALKLHFTSNSYDFFRYNGKTNVSKDKFAGRKDRYSFYKLSRKYSLQDLRNFYIANFIANEVSWIGNISGLEGEEVYKKWQKTNQRLTYQFEQDIINLFNSVESPNKILEVVDGQHPLLLREVMSGAIALETLVILNGIMNFLPMWKNKIKDDIIWPNWRLKIEKYTPFVHYDKDKFKQIVKDQLHEHC